MMNRDECRMWGEYGFAAAYISSYFHSGTRKGAPVSLNFTMTITVLIFVVAVDHLLCSNAEKKRAI